ncbi:MAG: hypothetical protein LRS49_02615 [Desulfurococcales archaeon]|nr:hypothetical protein [Desulfurococcales archaeon]
MPITANIIEIEGLAMNGMLREVSLEDCERPPGWKRIVAVADDGRRMSTSCMEPDAAKRNYMVMSLYLRQWGKLVYEGGEVEGKPEEE